MFRVRCHLFALGCCLALAPSHAEEEDEIVTGCHGSNAEWGIEAVHRCIDENRRVRAEVLAYPAQHQRIVNRCRRIAPAGWSHVKDCVDKDIAAAAALSGYPQEKAAQIEACLRDWGHRGAAAVQTCVDTPGEIEKRELRERDSHPSEAQEPDSRVRHQ